MSMKRMSTDQIRQAYLDFFKERGHAVIPSASLLPDNDPTTLFTGSGMQPMLPYLLGEKHPLGNRIADSQKSFRSVDIEEVGDNRHTTFFEMLGNWSLGDYFKKEQIPWMFEFLTKTIGLDPKRIYVTVFRGNDVIPRDMESVDAWKTVSASTGIDGKDVDFPEKNGMQDGRIFYYDEKKNWWSRAGEPAKMPAGEPGGPDSEMFWDFGAERKLHERSEWKDQPCHVNCDCGRFLEIGNNVFMEYKKTANGFEKLAQQNVDFGGGLERIAAALNDDPDVFFIDVFTPVRELLQSLSGKTYGSDEETMRAFRVIMDHLRAATFLIADGAPPSNRDQGYFTRRLIRRAVRFANAIGIPTNFTSTIAKAYIAEYGKAYPALASQAESIALVLDQEEVQFRQTLQKGEKELSDFLSQHDTIDGGKIFYFYETYGFPRELTEEIVARQGKHIMHPEHFEKAKASHADLSRTAAAGKFAGGLADHSAETTKLHTATHLLNAALRKVLGPHVQQKGSNITAERLRFDFNHPEKMTAEQIEEVERLVNEAITADLPIAYHLTTVDGAKTEGAIGVFDERYGSEVKVYVVGDPASGSGQIFSKEICGGPHVARTGMLGRLTIQKEESCAAGVRRIKAVVEDGPADIETAGESA
ncbi:MAG: Alanine--tRNA ligase [Candidatus Peregrinibacteria bacterium Gr01-1014_25]|nr:MAG: Alanine--tRNA ligase [Candidatus Peregrinibacteria bacterium Gr01-1014_25]